mmetsp:Transcript_12736/g.30112  ORF Transcript_12736/g.30112 Transcript_12736/m.30112 type:complete len:207 (+) Transcript_12736:1369-1989(+)
MNDELVVDDCAGVSGAGNWIVSVALVSLPFRWGVLTQQRQCLGLVVKLPNVAEDVRRLRSLGGEISRVVVRRVIVVHSSVEDEVSISTAVYEVSALRLASGAKCHLRSRGWVRVLGYVASRRANSPAIGQITTQVRLLTTAVVRLAAALEGLCPCVPRYLRHYLCPRQSLDFIRQVFLAGHVSIVLDKFVKSTSLPYYHTVVIILE